MMRTPPLTDPTNPLAAAEKDSMNFNDSADFDESEAFEDTRASGSGSGDGAQESHMDHMNDDVIGKKETKAVYRIKFVVLIVLVACAAIVATTVYVYLSRAEHEKFVKAFQDDSTKILEAIGASLDKSFGLLDGLAVSYVSMAHLSNQTWPFVSMPNVAVRMAKILPLSDAISINFLPVVSPKKRKAWEMYAAQNDEWVNQGMSLQEDWDFYYGPVVYNGTHNAVVHSDYSNLPYDQSRDSLPLWQNFPVIPNTTWTYGWDWLTVSYAKAYSECIKTHRTTISAPYMLPTQGNTETELWADYYSDYIRPDEEAKEPISDFSYPIVGDSLEQIKHAGAADYDPANHTVQGLLVASVYWRKIVSNILPDGSNGIRIVFDNECAEAPFTYQINAESAEFIGMGDDHDHCYDGNTELSKEVKVHNLKASAKRESMYTGAPLNTDYCPFTLRLYPSGEMESAYRTYNPIASTCAALLIFLFTSLVFHVYDVTVERRQKAVLQSAVRSSAIVSSLFPSAVRDRLYPSAQPPPTQPKRKIDAFLPETAKSKLQGFLKDGYDMTPINPTAPAFSGSPIAELYPDTTVLFADIAGFTSWSSTRQPTQVFTLLETLYAAFDAIAKQRGVFKVETIGDCYVAVVGLPTPRKSHAVVMVRFASDCRAKMDELTLVLEKTLGPGTADLALRIGLNSGPTTAGVLRGEKSRFQLFGDTVNTAARMESNGERNRIHISEKTAELLKVAGKEHWLSMRKEQVDCKGKGLMTTFWCEPRGLEGSAVGNAVPSSETASVSERPHLHKQCSTTTLQTDSLQRLIDWNVVLFTGLLNEVVKHRGKDQDDDPKAIKNGKASRTNDAQLVEKMKMLAGHPIDEVAEVLSFPKAATAPKTLGDSAGGGGGATTSGINAAVEHQLTEFITSIAHMYQANAFHNFEHCSHVVMSTKKLLDRIVENSHGVGISHNGTGASERSGRALSDPLTRLAILFSAMIHDLDHPGVSNAQLVQEQHALAVQYTGKSVAEQNSIEKAWLLLMQPQFGALRASLFATTAQVEHFRRIVVNVVLATDLFDQDLKAMREARWIKSFDTGANANKDALPPLATAMDTNATTAAVNRRTTIILDLIIQASDVSHTMHHFTVYKKWNTSLLVELYEAYLAGRTNKNPLDGWYDGELWFFDNYVIPLAQKLRECGVFGVSCDEFLDYARDNRQEWQRKGRDIVQAAAAQLRSSSVRDIEDNEEGMDMYQRWLEK